MRRHVTRRFLSLLPVWAGISFLAFSMASLAPGDPAFMILERQAGMTPTREAVEKLRRELGLNDPFLVRYTRWLGGAVTGNLGRSYRTGEPVVVALRDRFPATLQITLLATVLAVAFSIPLGVVSAVRRNSTLDHASRVWALLGASLPSFWLAYLLILFFAILLGLLPVAGSGTPRHVILPSLTLGLGAAAILTRLTRSSLLETLGEDYVRTARAKGIGERAVVARHALRNALIPVLTAMGNRFGHLLGGAAIVETVFGWPGIGKLVVDAIYNRDYPMIQGFVLFMGTVFVLLNLAIDLLYVWIDPRIRLEEGERG